MSVATEGFSAMISAFPMNCYRFEPAREQFRANRLNFKRHKVPNCFAKSKPHFEPPSPPSWKARLWASAEAIKFGLSAEITVMNAVMKAEELEPRFEAIFKAEPECVKV